MLHGTPGKNKIAISAAACLFALAMAGPLAASEPKLTQALAQKMSAGDRVYLSRGLTYRTAKDYETAITQFDLIKHPETVPDTFLILMADTYNMAVQNQKALDLIDKVVERAGDDKKLNNIPGGPFPLAIRADAYIGLHKPLAAAADDLKQAELMGEGGKMYLGKAADVLRRQGKYAEAIVVFDRALKMAANQDDVLLHLGRGCCLSETKKYEAALKDFSEGLKLDAQPGRTNSKAVFWTQTMFLNERAKCYDKLGRLSEAAADRRKCEKLSRTIEDELYGK